MEKNPRMQLVRIASFALLVCSLAVPRGGMASAASASSLRPDALAPGAVPSGSAPLGSLPGGQLLQLSVVLPPSRASQLQVLLHDLYTPGSPSYHQWLPHGQFSREFGPTASQLDAVQSWLHGVGLTQTSVSDFSIQVTGTASQIASALGTSFERYRTPSGHEGYEAQQVPRVPVSLAGGQIDSILGLNTVTTFQPQITTVPSARPFGSGALQPHASIPNATGVGACSAARATAGSSYYTLDTLGSDYGIGSLVDNGQNGHGQTLGLYELASSSTGDVAAYKSCFGLTDPVSTSTVDGGGGPTGGGGTEEADADIEQAATQAPQASLVSYEGPNTGTGAYDTWSAIVSADVAREVSTSWGICEPLAASDGFIPSFSTLFEEAAAQGQTVLAASGDSGSEGCYPDGGSTALEVDYPASDPWVTAVGGTELLAPGNEVAWTGSGAGSPGTSRIPVGSRSCGTGPQPATAAGWTVGRHLTSLPMPEWEWSSTTVVPGPWSVGRVWRRR